MSAHDGGIDVEHDNLTEVTASDFADRDAFGQLGPHVSADPSRTVAIVADLPAVTSSRVRHTVGGEAIGPWDVIISSFPCWTGASVLLRADLTTTP